MATNLIVIGGGAAGFFGAVNAARLNPGWKVTILEKSRKVLSKVRISGGGRCNVTHHCFDNEQLAKAYPRGGRELRWAFEQFDAQDTIRWFGERGVDTKTEADGRMFPVTDNSATIINCLQDEARRHGVQVRTKTKVQQISPQKNDGFIVDIGEQHPLHADKVLIASGGYNRRSMYSWMDPLQLPINAPVPSLFTFNFREKIFSDLAGISVPEASVSIIDSRFEYTGPLLITHWGLSGPAVLKTSAWAARFLHEQEYRFEIAVNWLHPQSRAQVQSALKTLREDNARKKVRNQHRFDLPNRLWATLLDTAHINPDGRWADLSNEHIHRLTQALTHGTYTIQGKTTHKEEFVSCGGVALEHLNMGTMQSNTHSGLYLAGEVLDIDGITGGYNFQSAWTTGWIAARNMGQP